MISLSALYPELRPFVPGCPEPVMDTAMRAAAIEFCTYVNVISLDTTPVELVDGQREYTLAAPTGYQVVAPLELYTPRAKLFPADVTTLARAYPTQNWRALSGDPVWFLNEPLQRGVVDVVPVPTAYTLGSMTGYAHMAPAADATTFDARLLQYRDAILAATKALLYSHGGTSYARLDAVATERAKFNNQVARARISSQRSGVYVETMVEMAPMA